MNMRNLQSNAFKDAEQQFNEAIDNDDLQAAQAAYNTLLTMLHPRNVLRELLKIQMVGIGYD